MEGETKETQETKVTQNNTSAADELAAVATQLEGEKKARAALAEATEKKDFVIADLETKRGELEEKSNSMAAELASVTEARDQAVAKYLGVAKAANPNVPEAIIAGATIAEIDASIEKGKAIVESVKAAMESEAAKTKVPAGAPTRAGISTEGLSAREKIAAGIQPKGGS